MLVEAAGLKALEKTDISVEGKAMLILELQQESCDVML